MKVTILTEGGRDIGFGHITRCISLADIFERKGIDTHFVVNADDSVRPLLKRRSYCLLNWFDRKTELFKIVKGADIVIVDSYLAGPGIYKKISHLAESSVFLDDDKRLRFPGGVVVNPAIYAKHMGYPAKKNIRYLLGPQYMYLRKEFGSVPKKTIRNNIKSITITFGGDDKRNMTPKVLNFLNTRYPNLEKNIIIGRGFSNMGDIRKIKGRNIKRIHNPDAGRMKNAILASDIVITACGQTLQELARTGTPCIGISVAKNQMINAKNWAKTGFLKYIGRYNDKHLFSRLAKAIGDLQKAQVRRRIAEIGKSLIDGKGSARISEDILSGYYKAKLHIRKAKISDTKNIYKLANEDLVRKNSFKTEKFGWKHHSEWFREKLKEDSCVFLVLEVDEKFVGQVRFNIDAAEKEATVNFSLIKKMRGLKLSSFALEQSIKKLNDITKKITTIKACVKKGNIASDKSFKSARFNYTPKDGEKAKLYVRKII